MTIIEAMKVLLAASGHEDWYEFAPAERHITTIAAQGTIGLLVSAYERLAPDWSQAPEAQYYAIDANGKANWHATKPRLTGNHWWSVDGCAEEAGFVEISLGVDWRLCIWQRPEAQP